jgi:hypothetical protein
LFERAHHRRIASLLSALDAAMMASHRCLFGGGTAIALLHGEYRESRDVDFMVSDRASYRALRSIVSSKGIAGLFTEAVKPLRDVRMDQYGIRTLLEVDGMPIKFEIVLEARIELDHVAQGNTVCGVRTLSHTDQVAEKLLANADRWADDSADARDLIDLAMMLHGGRIPMPAFDKAHQAYSSIEDDLKKAQKHIERPGRLMRCMANMGMTQPPGLVLDRIRKLKVSRPRPTGRRTPAQ